MTGRATGRSAGPTFSRSMKPTNSEMPAGSSIGDGALHRRGAPLTTAWGLWGRLGAWWLLSMFRGWASLTFGLGPPQTSRLTLLYSNRNSHLHFTLHFSGYMLDWSSLDATLTPGLVTRFSKFKVNYGSLCGAKQDAFAIM